MSANSHGQMLCGILARVVGAAAGFTVVEAEKTESLEFIAH